MNYFALAGAIVAALIAAFSAVRVVVMAASLRTVDIRWLLAYIAVAAITIPVALWLFPIGLGAAQ